MNRLAHFTVLGLLLAAGMQFVFYIVRMLGTWAVLGWPAGILWLLVIIATAILALLLLHTARKELRGAAKEARVFHESQAERPPLSALGESERTGRA